MQHTSAANEDNTMQAAHQKRWLIFFCSGNDNIYQLHGYEQHQCGFAKHCR